jgi:hypothetical protein
LNINEIKGIYIKLWRHKMFTSKIVKCLILSLLLVLSSLVYGSPYLVGKTISFTVLKDNERVIVDIYNMQGDKLYTSFNRILTKGEYKINPFTKSIGILAEGVYLVNFQINSECIQFKMDNIGYLPDNSELIKTSNTKPDKFSHKIASEISGGIDSSTIVKDFSNRDIGGEAKLGKVAISFDEKNLWKIFEAEIKSEGHYYISTWVRGGYKEVVYTVDVNGVNSGCLVVKEDKWLCASIKGKYTDQLAKPIYLKSGMNKVRFHTTGNVFPQVEFIRVASDLSNSIIPEPISKKTISKNLLLSSGSCPECNCAYDDDIDFSYTYSQYLYLIKDNLYQIMTYDDESPEDDPVMYLYYYNNTDNGTWADDDAGPGVQSYIYCVPSVTGIYRIVLRAKYSDSPGEVGLKSAQLGTLSVSLEIGGNNRSCSDVSNTGELNYFTCESSGDPEIWTMDNTYTTYGKVRAFNDDYSTSGNWNWGNDARIKKNFGQTIISMLVAATSTQYEGTCDAFMKAYNGTIWYDYKLVRWYY